MSALDNTTGSITQKISRPFSEVSKGYTYFEDGDILFAKITPCMQNGKSAIAENLTEGFGFGSTEFHILRSKPGVNKKWIYHFIRTQEYRIKAQDHFEGSAGQQRVSGAFIENSLIPFPPTPEDQSTIANELESKMAEVEKMRQAALRQKEAVEVHREALLRRYFPYKEGDPLPKGWQWYELGDILKFKNGINFSSSEVGQGTLTLDVYNMYTETLQPQLNNLYRVNKNISDEYLLKEDDILFVRSSVKREGVGWPTVFKGYEEPVSFCGFIIRGRLVRDDIIPQYLVLYSRMASVREKFISASGQTTITNISQDNLRRVRVPIPSKKQEQNVIVEKIENKFIKMEKMQQSSEKQLEAIQALPAAILREVFDFQEANA
jgi:type I restriction enzyme S subunit